MTSPTPGGSPRVLVVGECLADLAPAERAGTAVRSRRQSTQRLVAMPGGSPANVAVGLARLGQATMFAGRFSTSGLGPWLRQHLEANKVELSLSVDAPEAATIALVTLDEEGRATYAFYGPETADWQWTKDELPSLKLLAEQGVPVAAVHTGSLAAALPPGAEVVKEWLAEVRRSGTLVCFDPNVRPGLSGDFDQQRRRLAQMVPNAHIVKASHEDVETIFPGMGTDNAAQQWLAAGVVAVVITEGANGARLLHRGGFRVHGRPPAVTVVDTIGAGDSFTAGLLAHLGHQGLLRPAALAEAGEGQMQECLNYALTVSAMTCTRAGADPPEAEEVNAFVAGRR